MSDFDFDLPWEEDAPLQELKTSSNSFKRQETLETTPARRELNSFQWTFSIPKNESRTVVFLDNFDSSRYTDRQRKALTLIGLNPTGGFKATIHNPTTKKNGKLNYYNKFLCPDKNLPFGMKPVTRFNMVWPYCNMAFKEAIDAGKTTRDEIISKLFTPTDVDMAFAASILSGKRLDFASKVFRYKLGERVECSICTEFFGEIKDVKDLPEGDTRKQMVRSKRPKDIKFYTVVDLETVKTFDRKGENGETETVTIKAPMKLWPANYYSHQELVAADSKLGPNSRNPMKKVRGINNYMTILTRGSKKTDASTGSFSGSDGYIVLTKEQITEKMSAFSPVVLEDVQPEAVFRVTLDNIRERLLDYNGYYSWWINIVVGRDITAETIFEQVKDLIAVPRLCDYQQVLTPRLDEHNRGVVYGFPDRNQEGDNSSAYKQTQTPESFASDFSDKDIPF